MFALASAAPPRVGGRVGGGPPLPGSEASKACSASWVSADAAWLLVLPSAVDGPPLASTADEYRAELSEVALLMLGWCQCELMVS